MTSPTPEHQDIVGELFHVLRPGVRAGSLGREVMEVDVYLPDGRGYIPDLCFLSTCRMHLLNPSDRKIYGAPDLVVEITSSVPGRDRVHKFRVYYDNGVPWYWIIDSETLAIEEYHGPHPKWRGVTIPCQTLTRISNSTSKAGMGST
jgi:Uma2 family endonuclease